ncbi:Alkaline phosphatase D [Colletotrichum sp. SAR11_239]|nr:Alkaline phosphatase D [Colletotrichum sp. SAR11_239]
MLQSAVSALALAITASAAFTGNLNYLSPSKHHASLGISIRKVAKRTYANSPWDPAKLNFTHGVASGDPYDDSVILWTRVAPNMDNDKSNVTVSGYVPLYDHSTDTYVQKSDSPVCINWKIATDDKLDTVVDSGTAYTSSDVDFTVKVEAKKLAPYTVYCNYAAFGFFNAYGNPVRKDSVDYVVHLGDYIYEYGNGEYGWGNSLDRIPLPDRQIYTLYDYRKRLATYRTDLDLLASHQQFPWIPVWDDHEVSDNTWRDGASELNNTEESFIMDGGVSVDQRKMNAVLPIRQVDMDDNLRIWRDFSFGNLFDLIMLDTRQYDRAITDVYWNTDYVNSIKNEASRSLMGPRQETWFYRTLRDSSTRGAQWRVIGNQIIFSRMNESLSFGAENPFNTDQWDGYQANRNRTFEVLYEQNVSNNIFLAGDSHASWVSDLVWLGEHEYDQKTGSGSVGVEFAGSAVSSPCPAGQNISLANANVGSAWLTNANRELQWQDLFYRGYYELSIDYNAVNASFFGIPTTRIKQGYEISLANFTVIAGENKLHRQNGTAAVGGIAESGSLKNGRVVQTNMTHDTGSGDYLKYDSP